MSFYQVIQSLGGIASIHQLRIRGYGPQFVRTAFRNGAILRIRRGWYANLDADQRLVDAARVGGTLTCVSACAIYGGWMPPGAGLHVAVPDRSRHLKHPVYGDPVTGTNADVVVHWNGPRGVDSSFVPGAVPVRDALSQVLRCQPPDFAFAVVESLLANGAIESADVGWLRCAVPGSRLLLGLSGACAGAGSESLFRFRMAQLGVLMRSQVEIPGVGCVDFLIGDRLIVEIDSRAHHGGAESRLRDLERDSVAFALGYLPLRFDYSQIISDWEAVASTVCAIIARRDHLAR